MGQLTLDKVLCSGGEIILGNPFHGLVRDGVLTLPNGDTKTVLDLTGVRTRGPMIWATPSWGTVPDRSLENAPVEYQFDQDNGLEWRDYAIVHNFSRIYGQAMTVPPSCWFYQDSAGFVYQVRLPNFGGHGTVGTPASFNIIADFGFGNLLASPTTVQKLASVSVPVELQDSYSAPIVIDVNSDGTQAICEIHEDFDTEDSLAFFTIDFDLDGSFQIVSSITTLRAIGDVTDSSSSNSSSGDYGTKYMWYPDFIDYDDPENPGESLIYDGAPVYDDSTVQSGTEPPSWAAALFDRPDGSSTAGSSSTVRETIAYMYDSSDTAVEIKSETVSNSSYSNSATFTGVSSDHVWRETPDPRSSLFPLGPTIWEREGEFTMTVSSSYSSGVTTTKTVTAGAITLGTEISSSSNNGTGPTEIRIVRELLPARWSLPSKDVATVYVNLAALIAGEPPGDYVSNGGSMGDIAYIAQTGWFPNNDGVPEYVAEIMGVDVGGSTVTQWRVIFAATDLRAGYRNVTESDGGGSSSSNSHTINGVETNGSLSVVRYSNDCVGAYSPVGEKIYSRGTVHTFTDHKNYVARDPETGNLTRSDSERIYYF